jgi:hypothetical protein
MSLTYKPGENSDDLESFEPHSASLLPEKTMTAPIVSQIRTGSGLGWL